jgi:nucleoside-diphosphate-sugar epimerase
MEKIAVTGSKDGFLSGRILDLGCKYIPRTVRQNLDALKAWLDEANPKAVIHCAGLADVRKSIAYPGDAYMGNTVDTITLVRALEGTGIRLIYVATDKVFGDQENCSIHTPFKAVSPYDASKIAAEVIVEDFANRNPCVMARFPNFYGPNDPHTERIFPSVVNAIKNKQETFTVRTTADSRRQYIFVDDAVAALMLMTYGIGSEQLKHHFGTPNIKSVREVINDLCRVFDHKMEIVEQNLPGEASKLSIDFNTSISFTMTGWAQSLEHFRK